MTQDHNGPNVLPDPQFPLLGEPIKIDLGDTVHTETVRVEAPRFKFQPQPDITPYELALVVEELGLTCDQDTINSLCARIGTDDMARHFAPTTSKVQWVKRQK
jgi:hypothetical protein